jgi:hypothetical protein
MRIFLCGPMTGIEDYNYPAFNAAAKQLRVLGYDVLNPAEGFGGNQDLPWEVYLEHTMLQVELCDIVATLDGWGDSKGANKEIERAKQLGKRIMTYRKILQDGCEEAVLDIANKLVNGDRGKDYGHPYDDYNCTIKLFNTLMEKKYQFEFNDAKLPFKAEDGIIFLMCVKLSREMNAIKRDNMIDLAGYAECYDKALTRRLFNEL